MKTLSFFAISLSVAAYATAAPIVLSNNLGQLTQPGVGLPDPITSTMWNGARFGTGPSTYTLHTVTLALEFNSFGTATLYSDQSGAPGVALGTLTTGAQSCAQQVAGAICLVSFGGNGAALNANANYWIVYSLSGGWAFTQSNAESIWARTSNAGSTWAVSNSSPMLMSVTADTPEPSTTAMLMLAFTAAALLRRARS
jgi:hypothetical protein